ncbi:MAG: hypothetical protein AAFN10_21030 [Bacteroidota bacterium]
MKAFIIGLCICFCCTSIYGQDKDYFQKGEILISLRNPTIGFGDWGNSAYRTYGSNVDVGFCLKDKFLIGVGSQYYFTRIEGSSNDIYSWGLQLFGRYYFARRGKKKQFIFYAEPRIKGIRTFTQAQPLAGDFINTRDALAFGTGLFCAWRPHKRISLDIGIQPQASFSWIRDPGQEVVYQLGLSTPPSISINFYI